MWLEFPAAITGSLAAACVQGSSDRERALRSGLQMAGSPAWCFTTSLVLAPPSSSWSQA